MNQPRSEDQERVESINGVLAEHGSVLGAFQYRVVQLDSLVLLEENARFMRNETFSQLVENIRRDGAPSSVPYCWAIPEEPGRYLVLSGNHRVKATRTAEVNPWIMILFNDRPLEEQERIAIQLSHNEIVGEDDPVILKHLWGKIELVDLKKYAGLDDKKLKELEAIKLEPLSEARLDFLPVYFLCLPEEAERVERCLEEAKATAGKSQTYAMHYKDYDRVMDDILKVQGAHNIKNMASALLLILDIFEAHLTDLSEGWSFREESDKMASWVPLASIFGTDRVPVPAAKVIKQAVDRLQADGTVTGKNLWQAIEYWAADSVGK